jgi:hypothetical protein
MQARERFNEATSLENLHLVAARVWGWVRWSPARFLGVAIPVSAAVLYVALFGLGGGAAPAAEPAAPTGDVVEPAAPPAGFTSPSTPTNQTPTPTAPAPSPSATPTETGTGVLFETDTDLETRAQAEATMRAFLTIYLQAPTEDGQSTDTWLAGLEPITHPVLMEGLRFTDPASVPPGPFGDPEWQVVGGSYAEALFPTDTVLLRLSASDLGSGWVVVDVQPVG